MQPKYIFIVVLLDLETLSMPLLMSGRCAPQPLFGVAIVAVAPPSPPETLVSCLLVLRTYSGG